MKKRLLSVFLTVFLVMGLMVSAHAETYYGSPDWNVSFTAQKKMVSNFKTKDLDEAISGLQPGDNIFFTVKLQNQHSHVTDWYMTNKVLKSLEDRSANSKTHGGAYTYRLTYTDKRGKLHTLFDSDTVGGENISPAGEGLNEATDGLEDYFYLDQLTTGQSGTIELEVALEGETQGNDYQDTLADLQMNFAVELPENNTTPPGDNTGKKPRNSVKTGDYRNLSPYVIAMMISGLLLLLLAILSVKKSGRDE